MSRPVIAAALVVLISAGLAACLSTPNFQSGSGSGDDSSHTGSDPGLDASSGALDARDDATIYTDAAKVYQDASPDPTAYKDAAVSNCVVGKPGSVTCTTI